MMSNEISPKVSVIVPVWNPGPGIRRCVESLRSQTLEDIEMIFVDDCGTDGAMDLVRSAAAEDPRIRIITNAENMGPGVSRNVGIEAARGAYLSFVDADDYMNAVFLESLHSKAIASQLDIVKGKLAYEREDGSIIEFPDRNEIIRNGLQAGKPLFFLFNFQHQSALFRRTFLLGNAIRYGTSRWAEDTTFLLMACHKAGRFDIEERAIYHYCDRNDSLMHDMHPRTLERKRHAFEEQMDYMVENMADEEFVSQYVARKMHYNLRVCNYLRKRQECKESCDSYLIGLREQVLRFPQLEKLKSESFIVRVLCDYGVALAYQPFNLPWEKHKVESYVETIREWVDFVKGHPECLNAAEKNLYRLFREADTLRQKDNSNGADQSLRIGRSMSAQAARLPFRCQRRIFEKNPDLPRPFTYDVRVVLKRIKRWKETKTPTCKNENA